MRCVSVEAPPLAAPPELRGTRVLLRSFRLEDLPDVLRYASDPEVTRHLEWDAYDDPDVAARFIHSTQTGGATWVAYAIALRETGRVIGGADLRVTSRHDRRAEIGYGLARAYWGHGYATEAAALLLRHGFEQLGLIRIQALCAVGNTRSVRTLERLGMRREGRLVHYRMKAGAPSDHYLYAVTCDVASEGD